MKKIKELNGQRLIDISDGWIPKNVTFIEDDPVVEFVLLKHRKLKMPFLLLDLEGGVDTVWVRLDDIPDPAPEFADKIAGFIFHMGRCGSTATVAMLRSIESVCLVPEPLAAAYIFYHPFPMEQEVLLMRFVKLVSIYVDVLCQNDEKMIIKWPSWLSLQLPVIQAAFPRVPGCFLSRDPAEVLTALLDSPPGWLMRARTRRMIEKESAMGVQKKIDGIANAYAGLINFTDNISYTEFLANALRATCEAAANAQPPLLHIDYNDFRERVTTDMVGHFGLSVEGSEIVSMLSASRVYAKDVTGMEVFNSDSSRKQRQSTPLVRRLSEELVAPVLKNFKQT